MVVGERKCPGRLIALSSLLIGFGPLFTASRDLGFSPGHLLPYTILAVAMPMLAMLYTRSFYWFTYLSKKLPLPPRRRSPLSSSSAN